jgi:hypothetical protein
MDDRKLTRLAAVVYGWTINRLLSGPMPHNFGPPRPARSDLTGARREFRLPGSQRLTAPPRRPRAHWLGRVRHTRRYGGRAVSARVRSDHAEGRGLVGSRGAALAHRAAANRAGRRRGWWRRWRFGRRRPSGRRRFGIPHAGRKLKLRTRMAGPLPSGSSFGRLSAGWQVWGADVRLLCLAGTRPGRCHRLTIPRRP